MNLIEYDEKKVRKEERQGVQDYEGYYQLSNALKVKLKAFIVLIIKSIAPSKRL